MINSIKNNKHKKQLNIGNSYISDNNSVKLKELNKINDNNLLITILNDIKANKIDINFKEIIKLLSHENNAIREHTKDIILQKINLMYSNLDYSFKNTNNNNNLKTIFNDLVFYLKNENPEIKNLTIELLCECVDIFLEEVGNLINKKNEDLKIYACQILGHSKKEESINYLKKAIKDKNSNVRNSSIIALENTDVCFDISFLLKILKKEKEPWIKFSITEIFLKKGNINFLKNLINFIRTEDNFIKINILKIFEKYCDFKYFIDLINNSGFFTGEIFSIFNKTIIDILNIKNFHYKNNDIVINYLIEIVQKDDSPWNIYQAIKLLSDTKDKSNNKLLLLFKENLKNSNPLIKTAALEALANFKNLDISLVLEEFFDNKNNFKIS